MILSALLVGIFALVGYYDVQQRRIPNALSLVIATIGLLRMILGVNGVEAIPTLATTATVFVVATVCFLRKAVGGGDVKLLAGTTLLIGYRDAGRFLLLMSLAGAMLAIAALGRQKFHEWLCQDLNRSLRPNVAEASQAPVVTIPYGLAIAASAVTILIHSNAWR